MLLLWYADFFKSTFSKDSFSKSNSLDSDQVLIWVQNVSKGYQQIMKFVFASKEELMFLADLLFRYCRIHFGQTEGE